MTAVEWLVEQIRNEKYIEDIDFEQAKEMEKQQIIEAVSFGDCRGRITTYLTDEQYYNETYGSKGSGMSEKPNDHIVDTNEMVSTQTDENGKPLTYWGGLKDRTCTNHCSVVCGECQIAPIRKVIRIDDINEEVDELIRQNELTSTQTENKGLEWLVSRWKKLQAKGEKMNWGQIIQITELAKEVNSSQTTSDKWKEYQDWLNEVPEISDEEIELASRQINYGGGSMGWIKDAFKKGTTWYREQLKQRQ